jgi:transcriptional regulator of acetoin/glycerol metabolism
LREIENEIKIHSKLEEQIFYPAYKEAARQSDEHVYYEALEEHHLVDITARRSLVAALRRKIHRKSNRAAAFIRVNCAALPEELVESELFGCSKGAYTDAVDRPGKFARVGWRIAEQRAGRIGLDSMNDLEGPSLNTWTHSSI